MSSLTPQQKQVAQASPASRQLVTAGPGTGKTHTLLARLLFLVDEAELSPTEEVLVLSFSRAAVREIRARLQVAGEQNAGSIVRRVRVQTFDSFATALLAEIEPEGTWQKESYEARIRAATQLLRENSDAKRSLSEVQHLLIDELQDLVGERDDLVRATLEATPGAGWTLFGDPAQGIYTFGLEDTQARKIGAWAIYGWLNRTFGERITCVELSINHRATSPLARQLAEQMKPLGAALNVPTPDFGAVRSDIEDVLIGLEAGGIDQASICAALRASERQKTAILCRNNGESLMLSRLLWEKGITHRHRRGAIERALPTWIAEVLGNYPNDRIAKESFLEVCESRCPQMDADAAFFALRRLAPDGRMALDLELLTRRIREGNVPDELCEQPDAPLTVSTVHRAKGLEFERVYLLCQPTLDTKNPHWEEELRVWYVALTRPRKLLSRLKPMKQNNHRVCKCQKTGRWQSTSFGAGFQKSYVKDYEVNSEDFQKLDPAGAWGFKADALWTQTYIRDHVRPGDRVDFRLVDHPLTDDNCPYYVMHHAGIPVGITSDQFGMDLRRSLGGKKFPHQLETLRVDAVDTVAGRPDTGRKHGLGERGLWLRVRVAGMAAFGRNTENQA